MFETLTGINHFSLTHTVRIRIIYSNRPSRSRNSGAWKGMPRAALHYTSIAPATLCSPGPQAVLWTSHSDQAPTRVQVRF